MARRGHKLESEHKFPASRPLGRLGQNMWPAGIGENGLGRTASPPSVARVDPHVSPQVASRVSDDHGRSGRRAEATRLFLIRHVSRLPGVAGLEVLAASSCICWLGDPRSVDSRRYTIWKSPRVPRASRPAWTDAAGQDESHHAEPPKNRSTLSNSAIVPPAWRRAARWARHQ
jgi:hypothetical protein